jgi:hypothetical protein
MVSIPNLVCVEFMVQQTAFTQFFLRGLWGFFLGVPFHQSPAPVIFIRLPRTHLNVSNWQGRRVKYISLSPPSLCLSNQIITGVKMSRDSFFFKNVNKKATDKIHLNATNLSIH